MCSQMLICMLDVNSAPLDVAYLCSIQLEHMCWKGWLVFQDIQVGVLTSKPLSMLGIIVRESSLRNENLRNIYLCSDEDHMGD